MPDPDGNPTSTRHGFWPSPRRAVGGGNGSCGPGVPFLGLAQNGAEPSEAGANPALSRNGDAPGVCSWGTSPDA